MLMSSGNTDGMNYNGNMPNVSPSPLSHYTTNNNNNNVNNFTTYNDNNFSGVAANAFGRTGYNNSMMTLPNNQERHGHVAYASNILRNGQMEYEVGSQGQMTLS